MKAVVYTKYGLPDVLSLKEVPKPVPNDNEVQVKVHATAVNDWDWLLIRGKGLVTRMMNGLNRPKRINILGSDIAGKVSAVGSNVKRFKPGDEVFGDLSEGGWGGFAEYLCAREDELVTKPANMTFEQAASIPQTGALAVKGVRDKGQLQPGQRVLFNGAGGGVGTLGIQIAKLIGAHVTAVDKGSKLEKLSKIGADEVIDYTKEDFTKSGNQYDLILDVVVNRSMFKYKHALSPKGKYLMIGGSMPRIFWIAITSQLISGNKRLRILALRPNQDLDYINELFEAGKLKPVLDRHYPLIEVPEAFRYFGTMNHVGKIIIKVR